MSNNYNTSTTGINLECNIIYDWDLARSNWEENFNSTDDSYTWLYTNCGNITEDSYDREDCEWVVIRGYSQGDRAEILVPKELREIWGIKDSEDLINESLKAKFTHLFYDYPYSVTLEINGEMWYSESLDGRYEGYDKDIVIKEILEDFKDSKLDMKVLEEELVGLVPDEPKYIDN